MGCFYHFNALALTNADIGTLALLKGDEYSASASLCAILKVAVYTMKSFRFYPRRQ